VLNEFVYAAIRLRYGLHQQSSHVRPPTDVPREAEILDRIATEAGTYAAQTYTAFVHVPNKRPLDDDPAPISEGFRGLLDVRVLSVVDALGTPVIRVKGDQAQRFFNATAPADSARVARQCRKGCVCASEHFEVAVVGQQMARTVGFGGRQFADPSEVPGILVVSDQDREVLRRPCGKRREPVAGL